MFIDSHCHLDYNDYKEDFDEVMQRAKDMGVQKMMTICTKLEDAQPILDLANSREELWCSIGVHPHEAKEHVDAGSLKENIESYLNDNKVIALGETGLDYYYEHSPVAEQKESFQAHIDLSKKHDLPLVIHTRDAEEDTVDMLKAEKGTIKGIFHCFSGSQWLADQALELGFYISISGIATFKKADDLREIIKTVPLDRLLLETDAPYLAPVPHRGKRNEPAFMLHTAEIVAELKGIPLKELGEQTTKNFLTLFNKI